MKYSCQVCGTIFNKKLTLKQKSEGFKPKFCSEPCAIGYKIASEKEYTKSKFKGARQSSKEELAFGEVIKVHFPLLESQYRIKDYDHFYDFYSPELNLLIEYNGTYWHSMTKVRVKDAKHLREATKRGIYIAYVNDSDWKLFIKDGLPDRPELVKMLNNSIKNMEK